MKTSNLDHTDLCILNLLQEDSRLSTKELAARIRMSRTAVFDRVKRLLDQGYIKHYTAILNREKINQGFIVLIQVQLRDHSADCLQQFLDVINKYDEVRECYHTTGQYDFNLKVAIRDMQAYSKFINQDVATLPNLVHVHSCIVISECKFETSLKLELT
jgi:Lrp/AsnC family leucine-responsive transcriptional regulator